MRTARVCRPLLVLAGFVLLTFSNWAGAEPPMRAARLGYIDGTVSFSPAGEDNWLRAVVNRPLTSGDRLWVDAGSRAELQVGGAAIRLGAATSVTLLNLDDRIAQLQLSQGTLKVRVRRMGRDQEFEVDTPNLAFVMSRAGEYRIEVDTNGDATAVRVQSGRAEVYGDGASYAVNPRQGYRFYGTGLSDYDRLAVGRDDELDRWARERDRRGDNSPSGRYVSSDVVGYEDLDANGSWQRDPEYGNVWTPNRVASGWTPYHDGHWSWVDPWGWTWVDDAPWGYAVSHYGRWASIRGRWSWVPGPQREQAVYAPAQVAFVGGPNFQAAAIVGAVAALIGWFPLAPREVYQPSYPVSRGYFERINRSNAVVAPSNITNIYNTVIVNKTTTVNRVVYVNQRVAGAVVAVPAQAFAQSQPVAKAAVPVSKEKAASAPVAAVAAVAPVQQSVHGAAPAASARPPARERRAIARTAPPPAPAAFAIQQPQLAAKPGRPIDDGERKGLKPAAAPSPAVTVVTTAPAPTAPPPATAPAAKSPDARKADAAKSDSIKSDAAKADAAKGEAARRDAAKAEAGRAEAAKGEATRQDAAKAEAGKAEAARVDAAKAEAARGEAARRDAAKAEAGRAEAAKGEATRRDAAKAEAGKAEAARADAAKAEAARGEAARRDAAKAEAAKADAARAEGAKAEAARAEAARGEATRRDAAKAEAAKAEAGRAEAARAEAARGEAARRDAAKAEAGRADAARAEAAKAAAARAEAARADAAKAATARAEAAKAESAKAEAAKAEREKARAARTDAEKADDEKKKGDEEPRRR
jgi:hypothetical protein